MSDVLATSGEWVEPSSRQVFGYRLWQPATVRSLLVLIHGFGEHGGRYEPLGEVLAQEGICVAAPDLPGHGRSSGRRGDFGSVPSCVGHLQAMTEAVFLPKSGQANYVVFGHSFGGLAAIHWAISGPRHLRRIIIQSPLLEVGFPIPMWKKAAAALLAACWPTASLSMDLDAGLLTHDPAVVRAYHMDPLVHNAISARTYDSILRTRNEALARTAEVRVPVLFLYGTSDRIVSIPIALTWFNRLTCIKAQTAFQDCYHELHHEPIRDAIRTLIRDWTLEKDAGERKEAPG